MKRIENPNCNITRNINLRQNTVNLLATVKNLNYENMQHPSVYVNSKNIRIL